MKAYFSTVLVASLVGAKALNDSVPEGYKLAEELTSVTGDFETSTEQRPLLGWFDEEEEEDWANEDADNLEERYSSRMVLRP